MRRGLTFACVVVASLTIGCGKGELDAKRGLPANTVLVTQKDIVKYPSNSPQRTLMSWWRSMQYSDGRGYLARLARPVRRAREADAAYRVQLPIIARQVDDAFPHITQVSIEGDNATVYTELEFRQLVGADKYATTRVAQAFAMVREDGLWRLADDLFVEAGVQDQLRALRQQDAKAGIREPTVRATPSVVPPVPPPPPPPPPPAAATPATTTPAP